MTVKTIMLEESDYLEMCESYGGYCLACGDEAYGIEPDARHYICESCGEDEVYGIEEVLLMGRIEII